LESFGTRAGFKNTSLHPLEKRFAEMEEWIEVVLERVALLEADVTGLRSTEETVAAPTYTRLDTELRIVTTSTAPLWSDVTLLDGKMNDFPAEFSARRPPQ
jgi:hypothetical protein